jgi:hypothetical protein
MAVGEAKVLIGRQLINALESAAKLAMFGWISIMLSFLYIFGFIRHFRTVFIFGIYKHAVQKRPCRIHCQSISACWHLAIDGRACLSAVLWPSPLR